MATEVSRRTRCSKCRSFRREGSGLCTRCSGTARTIEVTLSSAIGGDSPLHGQMEGEEKTWRPGWLVVTIAVAIALSVVGLFGFVAGLVAAVVSIVATVVVPPFVVHERTKYTFSA